MSTSHLGLDSLNLMTLSLHTFEFSAGLYNCIDPVAGAKIFGVVLPKSQPTSTETAHTKINGIHDSTIAAFGLGMLAFLQISDACTKFPAGPFVAAAVPSISGYSMLTASIVTFSDGYILQQFSDAKGLSAEAANTTKTQRQRYTVSALLVTLLSFGWIYG